MLFQYLNIMVTNRHIFEIEKHKHEKVGRLAVVEGKQLWDHVVAVSYRSAKAVVTAKGLSTKLFLNDQTSQDL